jgi:hypothetical protein
MKTFLTLGWSSFGARIYRTWCAYNERYFAGRLKPLPIVPTPTLPFGHCVAQTSGSSGIARHILLAAPLDHDVLVADNGVLLHEMVHQHLIETGQNPHHAGQPWCDCVMRLNKQIAKKEIFASPTSVRKVDGRSVRLNPACTATGRPSLPQQDIARWPHSTGIKLGAL